MLHIHFSNRYDALVESLLGQIATAGTDAFAADQVIVPSAAVRRSLTLAIARQHGLCANVRFDYLAQWLWQQIGRVLPGIQEESPFTSTALTWRVHAAFGDPSYHMAHPRLHGYLQGGDEVMRFELAQQVARVLEQYITYRPQWLEAWQKGEPAVLADAQESVRADEQWQAQLWRRISADLKLGQQHPARAFGRALERGGPELARKRGLPARVHVFALPTMPPQHIELLELLARHIRIDAYVLNPCQEYWFDLVDGKRLALLAAHGRAVGHEVGNRLLSAWGQQTQASILGLVEHCDGATDVAQFIPNPAGTLLAQLQNAMLELVELEPASIKLADTDRSVEVHVCHSLTRELEALQDRLLGLFAQDPSLEPADILVVTPDLEAAAPLIEGIFGTAPPERRIPYAITGRARASIDVPAGALLDLLSLAASRFAASDIFGLLQRPIVARRFGLDSDALEQVHDWMLACGIRWGQDEQHRASLGLPPDPRHTLDDGLQRLFLGYALPQDTPQAFGGRLACGDAQGSNALALGAFWRYAQSLAQLRQKIAKPQTPDAWRDLLLGAMDDFLRPDAQELEDFNDLRASLGELAGAMQRGGLSEPLALAVVHKALEHTLDDPARGGVPTGTVTFTSMSSLRNLPYRVVCALGLDDGAFPSVARPPEFDLMAADPRKTDRQRRTDERNGFLDLALAAQDHLHLSYTGRSVRDNSPLPPSVLLAELLDVLVPATAGDAASPQALDRARQRLVVYHPLQPFSLDCFRIDTPPRIRSFNQELARALQRSLALPLAAAPASGLSTDDAGPDTAAGEEGDDASAAWDPQAPFFRAPLPPPPPPWRVLTVERLIEFYRNPCRTLLRRRLGLDLQGRADELQDDEPFLPDIAARSSLAQRLLPALLRGAEPAAIRQLALAGTEMPSGALGEHDIARELRALGSFAHEVRQATVESVLGPHEVKLAFDLDGEAWELRGGYADLRPCGLVRWRYDETRATSLLEAWIHHLALCCDPPAGARLQTRWLTLDGGFCFRAPDAPHALLRQLLALYRRGLSEPVHFFPKTAWKFIEGGAVRNKAEQAWKVSPQRPFAESADPAYRLALRGRTEVLDAEFERLAAQVFQPMLEHRQ